MAFPLPFPYVPGDQVPDSFEDRVQQNMNKIALGLGARPQTLGVLQLAVGGTQRKVAFGAGTANGLGTTTGSTTVTHGLGLTPVTVLVVPGNGNLSGSVNTIGSTTFIAQLRHVDNVAWSGAQPFYWLAIG